MRRERYSFPDVCPTDLPGSIRRGRPIARRIIVCIAQLDIARGYCRLSSNPRLSASIKTLCSDCFTPSISTT